MTVKQAIGIDDRLLMWIGIPVLSFFIPLLLFNGTLENGLLRYLPKWGISFMYTVAYWVVSRQIFIYFRRRYTGANQTTIRLIYTGIALLVGFTLVNVVLWKICQPITGHGARAKREGHRYDRWFFAHCCAGRYDL